MLQYEYITVAVQTRIRGGSALAIASSVEDEVHAGRLLPGGALPTVRELGERLKVSPATVAAAYKLLRGRGLITGAGRGGTRVAPRPPSPAAKRAVPVAEGLRDLASGNPDPLLLPAVAGVLPAIRGDPHLYGDTTELPALMRFLKGEFDADGIPSGALTLTSGALDAIERTLREHLRPGDAVAVEDPSFPGLLDLLGSAGYGRVPMAVDDEGPVPADVEQALRRASAIIVTPRAQNPTGAALSVARAKALRRLLRARPGVLLIENDPAGPVSGAPARTLATAGVRHWVVVRSTSKFLGPDLRLAAVAGDDLTIARVEGRQALGARWVSTILQQIVLGLWADPSSGRWLARAADLYTMRRQALLSALAARGIAAHGPSGFNVWIPVREESVIVQTLAERGWAVLAGQRCRLRSGPAIRVTVSTLLPADAPRFAADLASVTRRSAAIVSA